MGYQHVARLFDLTFLEYPNDHNTRLVSPRSRPYLHLDNATSDTRLFLLFQDRSLLVFTT